MSFHAYMTHDVHYCVHMMSTTACMLQAAAAAVAGDLGAVQSLFLEAGRPAGALAALTGAGRWPDALHFAKLHLPLEARTPALSPSL